MAETQKVVKEKRAKKLAKVIEGNVLTITEGVTGEVLKFDCGTLPDGIKANLMPYGASQKIGDAAAGRSGKDAVDAMKKVWEGLLAGNWTTRLPAAEKISKKGILERYEQLPDKEKKIAEQLLKDLGILK